MTNRMSSFDDRKNLHDHARLFPVIKLGMRYHWIPQVIHYQN